jgi:hypothetical protein
LQPPWQKGYGKSMIYQGSSNAHHGKSNKKKKTRGYKPGEPMHRTVKPIHAPPLRSPDLRRHRSPSPHPLAKSRLLAGSSGGHSDPGSSSSDQAHPRRRREDEGDRVLRQCAGGERVRETRRRSHRVPPPLELDGRREGEGDTTSLEPDGRLCH